jgi:hypothetical protein
VLGTAPGRFVMVDRARGRGIVYVQTVSKVSCMLCCCVCYGGQSTWQRHCLCPNSKLYFAA